MTLQPKAKCHPERMRRVSGAELIIVFLGYPGSGKGTQAKKLAQEFGFSHVSTGEIFREIMDKNTATARKIKNYMETGNLVPDDITVEVVNEKLELEKNQGFILDGFPRNVNQALMLDNYLEREDKKIDMVFFFAISDKVSIERLSARRLCPRCGRSYNMISQKPQNDEICDVCGIKLIHRSDDDSKTIKRRFDVYKEQTSHLIEYYVERKKLVKIDAEGSIEKIFLQIKKIIENVHRN
ncbi:MAG: adenylate kinase [Elusimicrobiota bacterium]